VIRFSCKNCGNKIKVEDKHSGRRGKCPKCGRVVVVPDKPTTVEFLCENCGRKISVPDIYAGRSGKCPKCRSIVIIPKIQDVGSVSIEAGPGFSETAPEAFSPDPRLFDIPQEMKAANQPSSYQLAPDTTLDDVQRLRQAMMVGRIEHEPPPERKRPWLIDIFLYPTNKSGLTMIGIIVGIPLFFRLVFAFMVLLTFICPPLLLFLPVLAVLGIIIGIIIGLLFGMYFYWYLCECVRDSAEGGIRAPETIGTTPGLGELFAQTYKAFVCFAFFVLPVLLYLIYTRRTDAIFWALTAFWIFFFPMGLLAVIMFDSLAGLNPVIIIGSVFSAFLPYFGLISLLAGLILSIRFLVFLSRLLFSLGGIYTIIIWIIIYGSGIIDFYMMMVIAHLLGRFFYKYQEKLNWEV